jgi:hypothetical protein
MQADDRALPPALAALHRIEFRDDDDDGDDRMDFEAYDAFQSAAETTSFMRGWTNNPAVDGAEFRFFGQDGTGGLAGFWLVTPDAQLLDQPIVFFGSEGELVVVAANFSDYLWLLAEGYGPCEASYFERCRRAENPHFLAFAQVYADMPRRSAWEVLQRARAAHPDFEARLRALCEHG